MTNLKRFIPFVFVFVALMLLALPALAQAVPAFGEGGADNKVMAIFALLVPILASLASALLPSDGNVMRIVDLFAMNFGYAKNTSKLNPNTVKEREMNG